MKNPAFALLAILLAGSAQAQSISGVSGTLNHGATLVVTGTSFGTNASPAPVVWDNVESGNFSTGWQGHGNLSIGTESRHPNSLYCGTTNFQGTGGDGDLGYFTGPNSVLGVSWFCQYWFKLNSNWNWGTGGSNLNLANVKIFRMWNPGEIPENFAMATMGYASGAVGYITEQVLNPGEGYFENTANWTLDGWHCFQFEFKESSVNANDGIIRVWRDGALVLDSTTIKTREDYSELKRPFIIGFYNSWRDSFTDRDDFYIDDAYIENSWARVEIGNSPVYSQCSHREIQIPSAWSNTEISISVNMGSFPGAGGTYLFVISPTGAVSPGFALGGGDLGPPGAPSAPVVGDN